MKLQVALIFGEHMVLQRKKPIRIWGRSIKDDEITVRLKDQCLDAECVNGEWSVTFDAEEACDQTVLEVSSKLLGEKIRFEDVAIGEVWLAGGQSNMEFIMKYDYDYPQTKLLPDDEKLRCFTYPQSAFIGFQEIDPLEESGFWRRWMREEERRYFSAVATYMGMMIREKLDVPVGIISCNWGGSPAAAWTAREDLEAEKRLKLILDWHEKALEDCEWRKYIPASEVRTIMSQEQRDFNDRFMMGEDMTEFFKNFDPSKLPPVDYAPYGPGPRSIVRPSGLYENMLSKIAPYGIRGFVWYQGEDDDAREWQDIYDASMRVMITSWRKLWKEELPFYQIELAPFRGIGMTAAKKYDLMRHQQAKAAESLNDVYEVCILDAGEEYNIHPRHKKMVGERLGRIVMKHTYGDTSLVADCPRAAGIEKKDDRIEICFENAAEGLVIRGDLKEYLIISSGDDLLGYDASVDKDRLILRGDFKDREIRIEFCESNYCVDPLYNSEGNPAFGFTYEV